MNRFSSGDNIPGKYRSEASAWDALQDLLETRH
jgi:hypothetical protein